MPSLKIGVLPPPGGHTFQEFGDDQFEGYFFSRQILSLNMRISDSDFQLRIRLLLAYRRQHYSFRAGDAAFPLVLGTAFPLVLLSPWYRFPAFWTKWQRIFFIFQTINLYHNIKNKNSRMTIKTMRTIRTRIALYRETARIIMAL